MKSASFTQAPSAGFSLIEMVMTIAILGVMISIALPWYGKSGDEARQARDQRNAQNICSLCQAVEAAGLELVADHTSTLDIARQIAEGITIEKGVFKGRTFRIPNLGQEELEGAARFLNIHDGQVRYDMDAAQHGLTPQSSQS
ncbi:type II secretion system protein [Prosthecobacter sp. SYSU 5D2]|uniref:type II secretion system protein n=1 Tax=Prosthecobacter sp. SYSU 5D2 TaxID=3134134 RepID=UPI0031FEEF55